MATTSPLSRKQGRSLGERKAAAQIEELLQRAAHGEALAALPALLERYPQSADLYHLLGVTLLGVDQAEDAVAAIGVALTLAPRRPDFLANHAIALGRCGRSDEALAALDEAIRLRPDFVNAHFNRGNLLWRLRRLADAIAAFDIVVRLRPDHVDAWNNRAVAQFDAGLNAESLASAERAVALAPRNAAGHYNRGLASWRLDRNQEALEAFDTAHACDPTFARAGESAMLLRATIANWRDRGSARDIALGLQGEAVAPWAFLAIEDRPDHHRLRAERWVEARCGGVAAARPASRTAPQRLRIGYFSADFHEHATMHLMRGLFELHDSDRYEIHGFSFGAALLDDHRRAASAAMAGFHEIGGIGDAEAAALARSLGIDVAIDLKGHTQHARIGIFAHRAAPVQAAYLGYPGTTGAPFIDYLIADAETIPDAERGHYSEALVRLPGCFLATDNTRPIAADPGERTSHGLPENGFVFCSFNGSFKISPDEFDIWTRLLGAVEDSVLWLLDDNRDAVANLRMEAARRGIAPERLVFAPRLPSPEHLARHRHADLCLDSFNCNAHTTAVDALWAGTPILTTPGRSFAARVAASLCRAMEMDELVVVDRMAYEARALALANDRHALAALRARLSRARSSAPLFDSVGHARNLEAAYQAMHAAGIAGKFEDITITR